MLIETKNLKDSTDTSRTLPQVKKGAENNKRKAIDLCGDEKALKRKALVNITNRSKQKQNNLSLKTREQKPQQCQPVNLVSQKTESSERVNCRPAPERVLPPGVEYDIDLENWEDTARVPEYATEVFEYLKSRERHFRVEDYIESQGELRLSMRSTLVDWMVSVQCDFGLHHETLFRAVKLVDLYLMRVALPSKTLLQLLGITSLFVAGKYGEYNPPTIGDCEYITANSYTHHQIVEMEVKLLKAVGFDLGIPDSYSFLRRYIECAKVDLQVSFLAKFILEYSLLNYVTISFSDSKMAAAALFIAIQNIDTTNQGWTTTLEHYTGYKVSDFRHIVHAVNDGMSKPYPRQCKNILTKYQSKKFLRVASVVLKKSYELNI